jgi:hypothetical protein
MERNKMAEYDTVRENLERETIVDSLRIWANVGELSRRLHNKNYRFTIPQIEEILSELEQKKTIISFNTEKNQTPYYISERSLTSEERFMYRAEKGLSINSNLFGAKE